MKQYLKRAAQIAALSIPLVIGVGKNPSLAQAITPSIPQIKPASSVESIVHEVMVNGMKFHVGDDYRVSYGPGILVDDRTIIGRAVYTKRTFDENLWLQGKLGGQKFTNLLALLSKGQALTMKHHGTVEFALGMPARLLLYSLGIYGDAPINFQGIYQFSKESMKRAAEEFSGDVRKALINLAYDSYRMVDTSFADANKILRDASEKGVFGFEEAQRLRHDGLVVAVYTEPSLELYEKAVNAKDPLRVILPVEEVIPIFGKKIFDATDRKRLEAIVGGALKDQPLYKKFTDRVKTNNSTEGEKFKRANYRVALAIETQIPLARTRENFHKIFRGAREAIIEGDRKGLMRYFPSTHLDNHLEDWLDPGWREKDYVLREFEDVTPEGDFDYVGKNLAAFTFRIGFENDKERLIRPITFIKQKDGQWKLFLRGTYFLKSSSPGQKGFRRPLDKLDAELGKIGTDQF